MHHQTRRARINAQKVVQAEAPALINGREPRYKVTGEMYASDIALGFVEAGWPAKVEG